MVTSARGKGAFAAIGNFDGVHRGHCRLIAETARAARTANAIPAAVVFDPHPRRFFRPHDPPFLLTTSDSRDALLLEAGAKKVLRVAFDASLAGLTPAAFVKDVLKGRLGLAGVATGTEFQFGKDRAGDAAALAELCREHGLEALFIEPEPEGQGHEKIGSSHIRAAIASGDMRAAAAMLGRLWSVEGVVARGQALGRTLGFPTANLDLGGLVEPRRGVYAIWARLPASKSGRRPSFAGVANFGRRPTVGAAAPLLEAHVFDFVGDLYGEPIAIDFVGFIRDEKKFDGLEALKAQIAVDSREARRILGA